MSKRGWILLIVFLVFLTAGAWSLVAWLWVNPTPSQPGDATPPTLAVQPTTAPGKELTYTDASGFSFSYPDGVTATDETPDDIRYYSLVVLKRGSEQMKFTVRDTEFTSVEDWLAKDREAPTNAVLSGPISVGNLSAAQYTNTGKRYTIAIKDRVLYLLVGIKDSGFWDELHERVRSTLAFAPPPSSSTGGEATGTSDAIYEEEEIVE